MGQEDKKNNLCLVRDPLSYFENLGAPDWADNEPKEVPYQRIKSTPGTDVGILFVSTGAMVLSLAQDMDPASFARLLGATTLINIPHLSLRRTEIFWSGYLVELYR